MDDMLQVADWERVDISFQKHTRVARPDVLDVKGFRSCAPDSHERESPAARLAAPPLNKDPDRLKIHTAKETIHAFEIGPESMQSRAQLGGGDSSQKPKRLSNKPRFAHLVSAEESSGSLTRLVFRLTRVSYLNPPTQPTNSR